MWTVTRVTPRTAPPEGCLPIHVCILVIGTLSALTWAVVIAVAIAGRGLFLG